MSNEQEYIKIYSEHKELINAPCAPLLNEAREQAFEKFGSVGFPGTKEENWLHTPVAAKFAADYGMNLGRVASQATGHDIFACDVPNLNTIQGYIVNDSFQAAENKHTLPEGVLFGSLNDFAKSHPTLLAPYYNKLAAEGDAIAQFNTTFVQDGILLYVPRNTQVNACSLSSKREQRLASCCATTRRPTRTPSRHRSPRYLWATEHRSTFTSSRRPAEATLVWDTFL